MIKRRLILCVLFVLGGALWGCDGDTVQIEVVGSCTLKCDDSGGRAEQCYIVAGEETCMPECLGDKSGENAPQCLKKDATNWASVVDTCKADDNGDLYSVRSDSTNCANGCDADSGLCNSQPGPGSCDKDCSAKAGGRDQVCVSINGNESCEPACLGTIVGSNEAVCHENTSKTPVVTQSIVDTCANDDLGTLYATSSEVTDCPVGCTNGVCNMDASCMSVGGGRAQNAFTIGGAQVCKNICLGQEVGENFKCWRNASLGPDAQVFAVKDTCTLDDNGNLYSEDSVSEPCDNGCTDGVCNSDGPSLDCQLDGGRNRDAFTINGSQTCKNTCLGTQAGDNKVCYRSASSGPDAPWHVLIDSCVADDNGALYSADSTIDQQCANGCTNGVCELDVSCLAAVGGGRTQDAYTINGERTCKDTCLGTHEGENETCWSNGSLGPSALVYAAVDVCAYDDNGNLYSEKTDKKLCKGGCTDGKCDAPVISLNCEGMDGGRGQVTVTIGGIQQCKDVCLGNASGTNVSCYQYASNGPNSPWYVITDSCALDDNGVLYSASSQEKKCPGTCTNNACDPVTCSLICASAEKRTSECFIVDGQQECHNTCLGTAEGENKVCTTKAILSIDTCKPDDNGNLYSASTKETICNGVCLRNTCNELVPIDPDLPKD